MAFRQGLKIARLADLDEVVERKGDGAVALKRGGLAGRSDILALGKSRSWIDREVGSKRLTVVKPGLYRVVHMTGYDNVLRARCSPSLARS